MALPLCVVTTSGVVSCLLGADGTGYLTGVLCTGAACSFCLSLVLRVADDSGTLQDGLGELGLGLGGSTFSRLLSWVVSRVRFSLRPVQVSDLSFSGA